MFATTSLAAYSALAAEGDGPALGVEENLKNLATNYGLLGLLLALALAAIMALFTLLLKSYGERALAVANLNLEHQRALAAQEKSHSEDRAEWHAAQTLLHEQRANLIREVVAVVNNATTTIAATQTILQDRQATAQEMAGRLSELVSAVQSLKSATTDDSEQARKAIRNLIETVDESLRRRVSS